MGGVEDWQIRRSRTTSYRLLATISYLRAALVSEGKQLPMLRPEKNPGQPPIFQRVGIVGLGLIGGSIALAAREIWPGSLVIGVDRKDVLERAMVRHAIDVAADDAVVLAEADLVILAAPIQQNLEILRDLA